MARSKNPALAFQPGARVRLTGGDNDEAIGLEGTIVEAPARTWDRTAAWRRGGAWVEWDGLADPTWEKREWLTLIDPSTRHHATKKKSAAQLNREIAETLKGHSSHNSCAQCAHATKRAIPGVSKWDMFAGGTSAAEGKHSYSFIVPEGKYYISPYTTRHGRHAGYLLKFSATGGRPRGTHGGLWHDLGEHRSPASAASAAAKHYAKGFE